MKRRQVMALALASLPRVAPAQVMQCVAPAKAGGGFDMTCQLVQAMLGTPGATPRIVYQPGGIGALTYREVVRGLRKEVRELVAFSSGTLLNIAQGRFGAWQPERIRWVAAIAMDHGVVAVRTSAPWHSLGELLDALRRQPTAVAFATGGTIGSQDWMKAAQLARAAGVSHKSLRVVAFEGGGDALRALEGGHADVLCGDAAELSVHLAGRGTGVRLLAVLSARRLDGRLQPVPTAIEQGVELIWPILRGVYTSTDFPASERTAVIERLASVMQAPEHTARVRARSLTPLALTGDALEREITTQLDTFRQMAERFGLGTRR